MPNRFRSAAATLIMLWAPSTWAKDNLNIGIVTFSTSDLHTNQMVDTMSAEAKSKGWTVDNLNANGDPSQAIAQIKQLVTKKADAIIVTVFDSTGLAAGLQAAADAKIPVLSAGGGMAPGIALAASTGAAQPLVDLMIKKLNGAGTLSRPQLSPRHSVSRAGRRLRRSRKGPFRPQGDDARDHDSWRCGVSSSCNECVAQR